MWLFLPPFPHLNTAHATIWKKCCPLVMFWICELAHPLVFPSWDKILVPLIIFEDWSGRYGNARFQIGKLVEKWCGVAWLFWIILWWCWMMHMQTFHQRLRLGVYLAHTYSTSIWWYGAYEYLCNFRAQHTTWLIPCRNLWLSVRNSKLVH